MYTRKQALSLARQLKTCPPPGVKTDHRFKIQVQRHIDICPFCSTDLKDDLDAWRKLSEDIGKDIRLPGAQTRIMAGQIRKLDPGLACWQGDYFYTPPTVVILKTGYGTDRDILVAQVWQDRLMAGPGDLVPPENMVTGMGELFVEPWNIYTLEENFLGPCLGSLDPQVLDWAIKMDDNPEDLPDWALIPMAMKDEDPRIYFRETEIELGFTFASMAADELLIQAKQPLVELNVKELTAAIQDKIPAIT